MKALPHRAPGLPRAAAAGMLAMWVAIAPAFAQAVVYRCGPAASPTYTHEPCPEGTGREVAVEDTRSAVQQAEAAEVARRAAESGQRMERERRHNEAARAHEGPAGIRSGGTPPWFGEPATPPRKPSRARPRGVKPDCHRAARTALTAADCPRRRSSPRTGLAG